MMMARQMMTTGMMMGAKNKDTSYDYDDMTIPLYSMRGHIMRRKWKKANVSTTSAPTKTTPSSLFPSSKSTVTTETPKMILVSFLFMISVLNLCSCVSGSEIRHGGVLPGETKLGSRRPIIKREINYINATPILANDNSTIKAHLIWTIERKECGQLDDGCSCESRTRNSTVIKCQCDDKLQVSIKDVKKKYFISTRH